MRLTRLHMSGFKSFADTINLPFDDGMTCIVGPNGCGKSNVSDAVRWVLGEQRARMLRGSRMDDVIFQGSIKRQPLNLSEVSLHFDNSDGTIPIAYQEVVVTRRLSRSGQSDYQVNQSPARLKDVQDLLRGTGLGSDAGVVIEARMIDRLLSDRAEERRSLFEEAAGIGLYRDRKGTTERRLEKTLDDLQRLDDVISEVHTQVRSLARQRGKAERHRTFTTERFAVVMELARRSLAAFDETGRRNTVRSTEIREGLPRARERVTEEERRRETAVQERATAEAQRTEVERRLADRRVLIEKLEGDLNLAKERMLNAADRKTRALEEREQHAAAAAQATLERDAASEEWKAAKTARESVQIELDLRTASEGEARTRLETHRTRVREIEDQLQANAEAARALQGERTALDTELQDLRNQAQEAAHRKHEATATLGTARERAADGQSRLAGAEREDRDAGNELDRARHALTAAKENEAAVTVERRGAEEEVTQLGARRDALEALEQDRAGIAPAAKLLLDSRDRFPDGVILGPLSDFLTTNPQTASTAERMLTEWLHAVVVRDAEAVRAVADWHREQRPGPLLLLPLVPGPRVSAWGDPGDLSIGATEPARTWARALLAGHRSLDDHGGAIRRPNGAVFLPGTDQPSGPLARRAELDELTGRLETARREMERLETAAREAAEHHARTQATVDQAVQRAEATRQALQEAKGAFDDASRAMQRAEREAQEAADTLRRIDERLEERSHRRDQVAARLREAVGARTTMEADLAGQRTLLASMEAEQETAREKRVHWQVEEAQVSARETAARDRKTRAEESLARATEEIARLERELREVDEANATVVERQARWQDELGEGRLEVTELEAATAEAERAVARATHSLEAAERGLEHARGEVEQLSQQIHQLELEDTELRGKRQALVERLEAEWHRPVAELLESAEPMEGEAEVLEEEGKRLAAAIESIGPVNPLAAEEYDEERTRLEFLQTQREDLAEARSTLETSLKEIDQTARAMFDETFGSIREHFQHVFHTLFEGGECDVRLADPSDPLESEIEIRAAPRGKRTQRIHLLSSGERALVALSLLFAIYLAKPSPFCLLDEVDAPLDDANVQRFIRLLMEFKEDTQFIVITHNPRTMQVADAVYGVTMQEPGVSSIVGVRLGEHAGV